MNPRTGVTLERVTVRFRPDPEPPALDDVTLRIDPGQFVGVAGPSGAGKTTLLRVIAGLQAPTSGTVSVGRQCTMGYVPQVETIDWSFPLTVAECLALALPGRGRLKPSKTERRLIDDTLDRVGMAPFGDRHIKALSGGQQQRVFLARALLDDPDLLLLDEPTAAVDLRTRHDVMHELRRLNDGGKGPTIILSTHDLNLAASHVDRIVFLDRTVVGDGPPAEALTPEILERAFGSPMDVLEHGGFKVVVDVHQDPRHHHG